MNNKKYYTAKELATSLAVTPMTIYRLVKRGELKAVKVGESYRFDSEEIEEYLKRSTVTEYSKKITPLRDKRNPQKRFSLQGIVSAGTVTDKDIEEAKGIWEPKTLR
ncbi:helix-turn-helix domain-containing protein [Candidatus Poribacteria bacterium]|nr:helix-turn-helix domain-containing protein [Candidatus Poribacteria bacterium]